MQEEEEGRRDHEAFFEPYNKLLAELANSLAGEAAGAAFPASWQVEAAGLPFR